MTMKSGGNGTAISQSGFKGSTSSIRSLLSRSMSLKQKSMSRNQRIPKSDAENIPPVDPNTAKPEIMFALPKSKESIDVSKVDCHGGVTVETVPPAKKDTATSDDKCEQLACQDPPVKVVVRIRPASSRENGADWMFRKTSEESLSVGDRKFTFDSVFDSRSNQEDIFQEVGVPLVKNALAGYNTSILSYGQSGSGKTHTMWGPPSSMVEEPSSTSHQGLVPRIFQMLFSEIERERDTCEGKQINYQCHCSFLEIYNEKIGDLLDPTQRDLQIKDDSKNGLYVEDLSEEYVSSYDDVTQILIKGLSSRKVGATTVNSKSSRSHIVFTCIIESWCKDSGSKCFSSSKTSRISLVDLAGSDTNKVDDASRQCAKESKNVKKSLSQLGRLVNTLAKRSQFADEDIPYRSSCLTHLLRESFGGNAKLTVICAISSDNKNDGEILSTLRFGQRVKYIRNDPVVNEITEDDVNDLSDQIRQLKEELIRAKSHAHKSTGNGQRLLHRHYARESLNQLRLSLNRSLLLPHMENSEEEINIDENDVKELCQQLDKLDTEDLTRDQSDRATQISKEDSCETDFSEDFTNCPEEFDPEEIDSRLSYNEVASKESSVCLHTLNDSDTAKSVDQTFRTSIAVNTNRRSQILEGPTLSESPKIGKGLRKSVIMTSSLLGCQESSLRESLKVSQDRSEQISRQSQNIRSSLQSSKLFTGPTESLAASLQRGLEVIDYHQRNSASHKSSVDFSFEHLTLKPSPEVDKANSSIPTLPEENHSSGRSSNASLLCPSCQRRRPESNEVRDSLKAWSVTMDGAEDPSQQNNQGSLAEAVKRADELESICKEQAAKIEQLTFLVEQYKMEKECYSNNEDTQGSRTLCIESAKETLPLEELKTEILSENHDGMQLLICNEVQDYPPEFLEEKCEVKEVQEELKQEESKEELLKEIHALRSKLQSYPDTLPNKSIERLRSSVLRRSMQLQQSGGSSQNNSEEELEREKQRWTEMESEWISLTDELRVDIETNRRRAEKLEMELRSEKNCTAELDDALTRAVLGHARMVEHYAELQDKYNDLVVRHRAIMEGIAEVKKAAAKAGAKGHGSRFAKSLNAELSAKRVEREREREFLKKENLRLKNQLRDTAEAVHAAGELLVRLREAEQATSATEENLAKIQEENDKLRKQVEKLKQKHKMEMVTMKQYLAESKLPESALPPSYKEDYGAAQNMNSYIDDDQSWRAEFGAIYQDHY